MKTIKPHDAWDHILASLRLKDKETFSVSDGGDQIYRFNGRTLETGKAGTPVLWEPADTGRFVAILTGTVSIQKRPVPEPDTPAVRPLTGKQEIRRQILNNLSAYLISKNLSDRELKALAASKDGTDACKAAHKLFHAFFDGTEPAPDIRPIRHVARMLLCRRKLDAWSHP